MTEASDYADESGYQECEGGRRIAELEATIARIRSALAFEAPRDRNALDAALAKDIAAGMSLRRAAAKHGTTVGVARGAARRVLGERV